MKYLGLPKVSLDQTITLNDLPELIDESILNKDANLNNSVSLNQSIPTGFIVQTFKSTSIPGFLDCDGSVFLKQNYLELSTILGNKFLKNQTINTETEFVLPNLNIDSTSKFKYIIKV
jgi:hypothetical protein